MNILICPSHNYIMPYGIMLESLFTNNEGEDIQVYSINDEDVTEDDIKDLDDIAKKHHTQKIIYRTFTEDIFNIFPNLGMNHVNRTSYYRLFAATLLPKEVIKILYIDGDIIISDNIKNLWETDVEGIAVAGVMNQSQSFDNYNRLHYSSKLGYINGGVLLINLSYWREQQVECRFIDFIHNFPERIKWHDQDVLNYVLRREKRLLPLKYNVQHKFYYKSEYRMMDYWILESEILDAQKNPVVLHFTGDEKPWQIGCQHPRVKVFLYYKKKTKWSDTPLLQLQIRKTWIQQLRSQIRLLFEFLHILPHKVYINKFLF